MGRGAGRGWSGSNTVKLWRAGRLLLGDVTWSSCCMNRSVGDFALTILKATSGGVGYGCMRGPVPALPGSVTIVPVVLRVPEPSDWESGQSSWKPSTGTGGISSISPEATPVSSMNFSLLGVLVHLCFLEKGPTSPSRDCQHREALRGDFHVTEVARSPFLIRNLYPLVHSLLLDAQRPQTGVTRSPGKRGYR